MHNTLGQTFISPRDVRIDMFSTTYKMFADEQSKRAKGECYYNVCCCLTLTDKQSSPFPDKNKCVHFGTSFIKKKIL